MQFLAPAAFALALLFPLVVLMYLLRLRRTERVVSSTYLWRRMVRDVEANAPWQRLRRNLLLLLQLLALGAMVVALARPFTWAAGAGGEAAILVFDASASMSATDVSPSRLGAAKLEGRRLVDTLPDQARVTVIVAGSSARVLLSSSADRRQAHLAIDAIQPGKGGSDMASALELASAVAARQPETAIVVYSDGGVDLPGRLSLKGQVRYVPMGVSDDNQAIDVLSLRQTPGGQTLTAFVHLANHGDALAARRLTLHADGALIRAFDVVIPAEGQYATVVEDVPQDATVIEARLAPDDVLALDDRAWTVHRAEDRARVTLVTDGNLFLETALSLLPGLEVSTLPPAELGIWAAAPEGADRPDLVVLDGTVPATVTLPASNLFYIAPPQSTPHFSVTGRVASPVPRIVNAADPLVTHVRVEQVSIMEAARVSVPLWARMVLAGDVGEERVPLLFLGEHDGQRIAVLAFDLRRSDLPLQIAFPLLLSNLMDWLAPGGGADLPSQVQGGAAVSFLAPPGVEQAVVYAPDGAATRVQATEGRFTFADTVQLGVYRAALGDKEAQFAVNMAAPRESDVAPAASLPIQGAGDTGGEEEARARREWWRPLGYAALVLLVVEWAVYHRNALARLASWLRAARSRSRAA
ncbi:MAG: VWA domain-containing protein [Anaerolineae bacterium]|nr:VWA domain-containing protein [Anaerolineae bacterium]